MDKHIRAYSVNGADILDFYYSEETGLYHWEGDTSYCGYTAEELLVREA